jgi:hypothetical protein
MTREIPQGGRGTTRNPRTGEWYVKGTSVQGQRDAERASRHAQKASSGAASGLGGLLEEGGGAPLTPEEIVEMESRGLERVAKFYEEAIPDFSKIEKMEMFEENHRKKLREEQASWEKKISDFEGSTSSGVTRDEYMQAKEGLAGVKAALEGFNYLMENPNTEKNTIKNSIRSKYNDLKKELMSDPTVRYMEVVDGKIWRQHIEDNGYMGGLVADGAHVSPEAHVDRNSLVSGDGLIVAGGVKIINSEITFDRSKPVIGATRKGVRATPNLDRSDSQVIINESVTNSTVSWSAHQHPVNPDEYSLKKLVMPKTGGESEPDWWG